jgi:glycosyltransferase involved in cell wall biosynthesis
MPHQSRTNRLLSMSERVLSVFSPLPPERNGIADYTLQLLRPLTSLYSCVAYCNSAHAVVPATVKVREQLQAFRYVRRGSPILHQIGNNPGHVFVLEALRRWGGVTTLHDQNLHYLYEVAGTARIDLTRRMTAGSARLGLTYARHWHENRIKTAANYALFDMLDEVLATSSAVVVHSDFAKRRIATLYGSRFSDRVDVIPHLSLPFAMPDRRETIGRLAIPTDRPLILTAGFATAAKRFDWLITALEEIGSRGIEFFWVHAGQERSEEYALSALIEQHPHVKEQSRITGYLEENDLNAYIGACDVLVNLRFPSVGESSGTMARAMSAGKCCLVTDTAAYADLPRDTVVHHRILDPIPNLVEALTALLTNHDARESIGAAACRFASAEWDPDVIAKAYREVIEGRGSCAPLVAPRTTAAVAAEVVRIELTMDTTVTEVTLQIGEPGTYEIIFEARDAQTLAAISLAQPNLLRRLLPPSFDITSLRFDTPASKFSARETHRSAIDQPLQIRVKGVMQ